MPRTARVAPPDYIYHVLTRGNNKQDVFESDSDFLYYLELLGKEKERYKFKIYHFVLMKNHVHLIIEPISEGGSLAEIMKSINISYAQHYKRTYRHIGHFWQDRFKSILVSRDEYLLACGCYVELNPVRAGIARNPGDYRWSSYHVYGYGKNDGITDQHEIYENLSGDPAHRRSEYRKHILRAMRDRMALSGEMNRKVVYGGEEFQKIVRKEFQLRGELNPRGRPRKK